MRVVFFGASQFGLRCLEQTQSLAGVSVAGVVTAPRQFTISYSPDRPVTNVLHADFHGWGKTHGVPVHELAGKMSDPELVEQVRAWAPDLIVVVGWYHLVPRVLRELPRLGVVGMHGSLLPRYRGGAPLVWAILRGERQVGITLFYFDEGVDTGDVVGQRSVPVYLRDTIASVYARVEAAGMELLADALPRLAAGTAPRTPQDPSAGEVVPQRSPDDGRIDWDQPALDVFNFVRAQTRPYPGAFTSLAGERVTVWEAQLFNWQPRGGAPGELLGVVDEGPLRGMLVAAAPADHPLLVTRVETAAHGEQDGVAFARAAGRAGRVVFGS